MELLHWIKAENHPAFWTEIMYSNWWKTFQNHFWYNCWCKEAPKKAFWFQFLPKSSIIKVSFLHWPEIWMNSWHPSSTGLKTTIGTLVTNKKWNTDSICLFLYFLFSDEAISNLFSTPKPNRYTLKKVNYFSSRIKEQSITLKNPSLQHNHLQFFTLSVVWGCASSGQSKLDIIHSSLCSSAKIR